MPISTSRSASEAIDSSGYTRWPPDAVRRLAMTPSPTRTATAAPMTTENENETTAMNIANNPTNGCGVFGSPPSPRYRNDSQKLCASAAPTAQPMAAPNVRSSAVDIQPRSPLPPLTLTVVTMPVPRSERRFQSDVHNYTCGGSACAQVANSAQHSVGLLTAVDSPRSCVAKR
jgi:hypothetical protein